MVCVIRILAALLMLAPTVATAQTLADVAKAEEARRKTVDKPSKVYTNVDLRNDFTVPATPPAASVPAGAAPAAPASPESKPAASASATKAQSPEKDETFWKNRMTAAKDSLNRSRMFLDALQSRINALTTQVINRDDPYQQATLEQDRQKNLAELERVKRDIDAQTKEISAIEEEARKAGVPSGWLR
jgi:hypothetical protein